ncbi:MAG TPA: 30S ribosome-binding factor RbfA [Tissierellales bacterium]|nr:30S ribosome-binding factor RbfA [Tissierellales bacterium]
MKTKRLNRISEEIKKVTAEIINYELKDPRINNMTSVTRVDVTNDLSYANIYISVLGDDLEKEKTLEGLESAKGFIRREIGNRVELRYLPEPVFHIDKSIEQGIYISKLIDKVNKEDKEKRSK